MEDNKSLPLLPRVVYQMCVHGALIVGSQAKRIMGDVPDSPRGTESDWDLLVPVENWQIIALLIPKNAKPNKFGGWRFKDDKENEIDVWPDTLQNYLQNCKTKYGGHIYAIDYIRNRAYGAQFING